MAGTDTQAVLIKPIKPISGRAWYRIIVSLITLVLLAAVAVTGASLIICLGPSPVARDLFVAVALENDAAASFVGYVFSEEQISGIMEANRAAGLGLESGSSLLDAARELVRVLSQGPQ